MKPCLVQGFVVCINSYNNKAKGMLQIADKLIRVK